MEQVTPWCRKYLEHLSQSYSINLKNCWSSLVLFICWQYNWQHLCSATWDDSLLRSLSQKEQTQFALAFVLKICLLSGWVSHGVAGAWPSASRKPFWNFPQPTASGNFSKNCGISIQKAIELQWLNRHRAELTSEQDGWFRHSCSDAIYTSTVLLVQLPVVQLSSVETIWKSKFGIDAACIQMQINDQSVNRVSDKVYS